MDTHIIRRCDPRPIESFAAITASHLAARGVLVGAGTTSVWQFPEFTAVIVVEHATRILISTVPCDSASVEVIQIRLPVGAAGAPSKMGRPASGPRGVCDSAKKSFAANDAAKYRLCA